jgi:hypothetical protein
MTPSLLEVRASSADPRACCSSFPRTLRVIPAHAGDPVPTEGAVVTGSPAFAGDDGRSISPCASSPRTRGSSRHRERGGYWVARSSLHSGPPEAGPGCRAMTPKLLSVGAWNRYVSWNRSSTVVPPVRTPASRCPCR